MPPRQEDFNACRAPPSSLVNHSDIVDDVNAGNDTDDDDANANADDADDNEVEQQSITPNPSPSLSVYENRCSVVLVICFSLIGLLVLWKTDTSKEPLLLSDKRWLNFYKNLVSGHGVNYTVNFIGSIEVLGSMETMDFNSRTRVARDSIRSVCTAAGVPLKERREPEQSSSVMQSIISGELNLTHSHTPVQLTISTDSFVIKRLNDSQIFFLHKLKGILFASVGEHDTKDYIAYVAKDNMNKRSCHVLLCKENKALDVVTTMVRAFRIKYYAYMRTQPGSSKSFEKMAFVKKAWNLLTNPLWWPTDASIDQQQKMEVKWNPMNALDVYKEKWFHGKIGRNKAKLLLQHSGDFLVRESAKIPGQFILSIRYKDKYKHLSLVDRDGIIRTKDYEFDSIQHFISYHRSKNQNLY